MLAMNSSTTYMEEQNYNVRESILCSHFLNSFIATYGHASNDTKFSFKTCWVPCNTCHICQSTIKCMSTLPNRQNQKLLLESCAFAQYNFCSTLDSAFSFLLFIWVEVERHFTTILKQIRERESRLHICFNKIVYNLFTLQSSQHLFHSSQLTTASHNSQLNQIASLVGKEASLEKFQRHMKIQISKLILKTSTIHSKFSKSNYLFLKSPHHP